MTIVSLSNEDKKATVTLSAVELIKLCNILYKAPEGMKNNDYYKLNSDMMLVKDLVQYGSLDGFSLSSIFECRSNIK